jgi:hypothetical protein
VIHTDLSNLPITQRHVNIFCAHAGATRRRMRGALLVGTTGWRAGSCGPDSTYVLLVMTCYLESCCMHHFPCKLYSEIIALPALCVLRISFCLLSSVESRYLQYKGEPTPYGRSHLNAICTCIPPYVKKIHLACRILILPASVCALQSGRVWPRISVCWTVRVSPRTTPTTTAACGQAHPWYTSYHTGTGTTKQRPQ